MEKEMVKRNDLKWEFVVPIVTWATYEKSESISFGYKRHSLCQTNLWEVDGI